MLGRDLGERLQIAQLQRDEALAHDLGGLRQALRGLEFALCRDDLGAPLVFGLGLRRDRALDVLRQVDGTKTEVGKVIEAGTFSANLLNQARHVLKWAPELAKTNDCARVREPLASADCYSMPLYFPLVHHREL